MQELQGAKNPIVCDITDLPYKYGGLKSLGNQDAWKFLILVADETWQYLISERDKRLKELYKPETGVVCAKAESNEADLIRLLTDDDPEGVFTMTNQLHQDPFVAMKELRYILLR
ncbi:hypothetical protein SPFM15_00023 [Salmonella phage SPFM15]|nr:hypothetical protein SPFM5_00018 [Salmonella phage SPFM5]VFR13351.1 hypothetical protein SPFM14_00016 [Salmonella phage SPFM14]VFR13647.1 hypothetical protein SPFM15_00023 [Salmonella phage SPFM15]